MMEQSICKTEKTCKTCKHLVYCKFNERFQEIAKGIDETISSYLYENQTMSMFFRNELTCIYYEPNITVRSDSTITIPNPEFRNELFFAINPERAGE